MARNDTSYSIGTVRCGHDDEHSVQLGEFTRRGAEVLACPIWDYYDELMQARAIENQVYLLASSYGSKSGLFNLDGKMLCQTQKDGEIVVSEIDLNRRGTMPGQGWWRARLFREVPPK